MIDDFELKKVEKKSIGQNSGDNIGPEKPLEEKPSSKYALEEIRPLEENIFDPSHYTHLGCPTVPIAFAGDDHKIESDMT